MFYTNVYQPPLKNYIHLRGFKDGKRVQEKIPFKPSLYTRTGKESKFKTLKGENLEQIKFNSLGDAKEFLKKYKEVSNFPIYGNTNFKYQFISKLFPDEIQFDISLIKILTIDIETTTEAGFPDPRTAQEAILLITVQDFNTKQITSFGSKPFLTEQANVNYVQCKDEFELLRKFIDLLKSDYPDIITGWNVQLFDIAYLSSRIQRVLGSNALKECSPYGNVEQYEVPYTKNRSQIAFNWYGVSILDYMDLYKKFSYKTQESYSLDYISNAELGKQKIKHDYNSFKEFYTKDWKLFVEYNIVDVELVDQLEEKMKLIVLILTMAYDAKCNFMDIYSSVRTWDCIICNALLKKNIIIHNPPAIDPSEDRQILGAFVKEPVPAKYDWVVSYDATSLYPSIMMAFNMSPDTLLDGEKYLTDDESSIVKLIEKKVNTAQLKNEDVTMVANGQCFRKDYKGILPELIEYYFGMRQKVKKQMLEAQKRYSETGDEKFLEHVTSLNSKQMAAKILMNSLYGASGNVYFRFYDIRIAEGITMTGQYVIRYVAKKLNEYLNKLCGTKDVEFSFYSDTDSTYLTLNRYVKKHFSGSNKEIAEKIDQFCETNLSKVIDDACAEVFEYLNVYQKKISFKREVIADSGVWIAKKRYALNVHNSEGVVYDPPKLKVQGMEIVRSSTPASVREALRESVKITLTQTEEELKVFISDLETKWKKLPPEQIAFPRSANNVSQYKDGTYMFKKGTPIHVRGALLYNHLIETKKLEMKYQKIMDGDRIKFLYLKEPNPLNSHVITFIGTIPEEFNLGKYVDYDLMFEKSFLDPLTSLLNCVGWQIKEQATLEGLFN
jgi:DNA polymerase elongation subunit (family B)